MDKKQTQTAASPTAAECQTESLSRLMCQRQTGRGGFFFKPFYLDGALCFPSVCVTCRTCGRFPCLLWCPRHLQSASGSSCRCGYGCSSCLSGKRTSRLHWSRPGSSRSAARRGQVSNTHREPTCINRSWSSHLTLHNTANPFLFVYLLICFIWRQTTRERWLYISYDYPQLIDSTEYSMLNILRHSSIIFSCNDCFTHLRLYSHSVLSQWRSHYLLFPL